MSSSSELNSDLFASADEDSDGNLSKSEFDFMLQKLQENQKLSASYTSTGVTTTGTDSGFLDLLA